MSESSVTDLRLRLLANGYDPVAVAGKSPVQEEWQNKIGMTPAEAAELEVRFPGARNTGINGERTPGLDADIYDSDVAEAIYDAIKDCFGDRGEVTYRVGQAPKFLVPFRADTPFPKILREFRDPGGTVHRLEFLGKGQQFVADGIHPDVREAYRWPTGHSPENTPRTALPEITQAGAVEFMDYLSALLVQQFALEPVTTRGNGGAQGQGQSWVVRDDGGKIDVEASLAAMHSGASVNDVQPSVIASLLNHMHPDDVLTKIVDATMETAERCKLADKKGRAWTREAEVKAVRRRILWGYNKVLMKDYDPATGEIPSWLPDEFHADWAGRIEKGRKPVFGFNRSGFYIRSEQDSAAGEHAREAPASDKPEQKDPPKASGKRPLQLQPFKAFDIGGLPPRSWLYSVQYQRRTVSLTAGPGGMGKSSLNLVEAIAMATGRNLLGEQPEDRLRVWYHNGEDPLDEIRRRIAAICQYHKIPMADLEGYLWITSGNEFPLRVAKGYANLEINAALVRQISDAISVNQIDVASFDPLVTLHSVSEMDPGKMDAVVRIFAGIADDNNAAIELAHHVRKPAAGTTADYDVHDIRGVAAITDAVRAARVLNRMNEKDAESAGCAEVERLARFRVDRCKGNYSPAQAATWRQFVSVSLANGDDVGVVAPWSFPGQGEQTPEKAAADRKAEDAFLQLLDKFVARGINVSASSGPTYAPAKFAEEKEAKAAKVSKAALKAAMNRLLDAGRIRSEPYGRTDRNAHRLVPWQETPQ